ncbi:methylated-DNA--[protein]-cysteine S-methyltransferase [Pseudomonas putida]
MATPILPRNARGYLDTRLGRIDLLVDPQGAVLRVDFRLPGASGPRSEYAQAREAVDAVAHVRQQLLEYFGGARRDFSLTLAPRGSQFLEQAWALLAQVPYGTVTTYGQLAKNMGKPGAARAIGMANAVNPISIIVPCHRVIAANGTLSGYSGGLDKKRDLLTLEAEHSCVDLLQTGSNWTKPDR